LNFRNIVKITSVEAIPIAIPLNHPLKMAVATVHQRDSIIVRICTDQGLVGLGEVVIATYFAGETQSGSKAAIDQLLGPQLVGSDVFNINEILQLMDRVLHGNPATKAGLDMALHDLQAQAMNMPLYMLLGGKLRDRVNSTWAISATDPSEAAEEALQGIGQGFKAIKIKVGVAPMFQDARRVQAVRQAIGEEVHLRADANQAWSPNLAIQFLNKVADCQLQFIEQPVHRDDMDGMAKVSQAVSTPVVPDEGLFNSSDAIRYIRHNAADGVVMKLIKTGGIVGCRKLAAVVQAAGIGLHLGGMPGQTSISAAAEVHLAVSLPWLNWDAGIYPHSITRDVVTERLQPVSGAYFPPEKPGLGVELDEDALRLCRLDK
jgi:o-succinylbenzoate synthase